MKRFLGVIMTDELKQIKKIYGEEMMHLCRGLFPTILLQEGLLLSILRNNIAPTHRLATDIIENKLFDEFKNYINSFVNPNEEKLTDTNKTPFELMDEAGYVLYECKSEEDIQEFAKYYKDSEVLCTIYNGDRLNRCYVFFAVKKNVNEIRREDFNNPEREDEYGTSVISIQFSRGDSNSLSIKNRYNHTVNNPDATFNNNLENIIPGLTKGFEKYYGLNITQETNSNSSFLTINLNYVKAIDGRYYRFNLETNGMYCCENNIIIRHGYINNKYANNPERYLLIDHFIVDLKEKTIFSYSYYVFNINSDSFVKSITDIGKISRINVIKKGENRVITIIYEDKKEVNIGINKYNEIISYENNYVKKLGIFFLSSNKQLQSISMPNVEIIEDGFLYNNQKLESLSLPNLIEIGGFLNENLLIDKEEIYKEIEKRKRKKKMKVL